MPYMDPMGNPHLNIVIQYYTLYIPILRNNQKN